jgi:hypothetical protein
VLVLLIRGHHGRRLSTHSLIQVVALLFLSGPGMVSAFIASITFSFEGLLLSL